MPKDLLKLQETTPPPKMPGGLAIALLVAIPIVVVLAIAVKQSDVEPSTPARTSSPVSDSVNSQSVAMSFEDCLARIQSFSTQYSQSPTTIIQTTDVRIVRFTANDGSVLVSCSRPDRKMVVTISPKR